MKLPKFKLPQKPRYKKIGENIDYFHLFQYIEQAYDTCFIFESLGEHENFSRYTVIGFDPQHIISAKRDQLIIDDTPYIVTNPYKVLEKIMPEQTIAKNYAGGLIGYLSYEAVNYFESSITVKVHDDFDQFTFGVYTDGLVVDKLTGELFYFYYDRDKSNIVEQFLNKKSLPLQAQVKFIGDTLTAQAHKKIVTSVKKEIIAGNTFECEVGFKSEFTITGDTLAVYEKLRLINPSPFMYYLKFGSSTSSRSVTKIIGASPELFLSLRNGELVTRPLAGTIQRGKTLEEDQVLARTLLQDQKEQAEHKMMVDLHRNDMGKIAQFGTVKVRELMNIKRLSHVQHIESEVSGIMRPQETMFSAIAANFPMGTVSGTPKVETMKIIDRNEPRARGPYGGAVGHFGFNGNCTFALLIRSLFISGDYAYTQTSSGVVYDSDPKREYEEVQRKLSAMKKVLMSFRAE